MKKTAYASSALSIMTLIAGLLFMLHQLPYSNYILALSLFLLAASMIIFYTLDKKLMYVAGAVFCFLPMVGIIFRQLNLTGSDFLVTTGLFFFGVMFIPWFLLKCYRG